MHYGDGHTDNREDSGGVKYSLLKLNCNIVACRLRALLDAKRACTPYRCPGTAG
jgi:hypothetical protein